MPYRLVEFTATKEQVERASEITKDFEPIQQWTDILEDDKGRLNILTQVEKTEEMMDELTDKFSSEEGFRLMLFSVEATVPRPEDDEQEEKTEEDKKTSGRISREELYNDIIEGSRLSKVYVATIILSVLVATVGLINDNVAVIIGSMVIAPLLGPNVSFSLALTLGDLNLARRSTITAGAGLLMGLVVSVLIGWFIDVDPQVGQIASRTVVGVGDIVVALAAGSAGVLAYTRGISAAVIGVMVAVALLPPLANLGLLLGAGYWSLAFGTGVLLAVNLVCINLAGIVTFLVQDIRPRTWWEEEKASKATRIALGIWITLLAIFAMLIYFWF
ncbi:MAG: TIGR00341 family protein [Balneolaceae bacterium]|nr:TIGR00341 family protein [Balneolaceae bacterium]